jgi:3-isopropylmalate dehydrogenase
MRRHIAVLAGDGIGPEVMEASLRVLDAINDIYKCEITYERALVGGAAFEESGSHLPDESLEVARGADAILFGSVGGPVAELHLPKWRGAEGNSILALRQVFQFNANYRPIKVYRELSALSPLRSESVARDIDLMIIRELLGDCYFGEHLIEVKDGIRVAHDQVVYTETQILSIAKAAFMMAESRNKRLCVVHKANVLASSRLWREIFFALQNEYKEVQLSEMLVDNCAMQLVINPAQFDCIVTSNMFGDILSDLGAALPGSLGLVPSASINSEGFGLYEPSGGSAQDIAGKGVANPIAQLLSLAMLLEGSFKLRAEAQKIDIAIRETLKLGFATPDIASRDSSVVGTKEFTDRVVHFIKN